MTDEDYRILYVAVTRAKKGLYIAALETATRDTSNATQSLVCTTKPTVTHTACRCFLPSFLHPLASCFQGELSKIKEKKVKTEQQ